MKTEAIIFARPPIPGRVKSRLAHSLGPMAAARLYRALLDHALAEALAARLPLTLALTEPLGDLADWRPPEGVNVELQVEGDLGTRMNSAFQRHFDAGAGVVVLIGSDIPGLTGAVLRQAIAALTRVPVVLGPGADGGYWLVGQRSPGFDLFSGVPWSSSETLAATRARLDQLHLHWEELDVLRDIDTAADLTAFLAEAEEVVRTQIAVALALDSRR